MLLAVHDQYRLELLARRLAGLARMSASYSCRGTAATLGLRHPLNLSDRWFKSGCAIPRNSFQRSS